jgi:hypothetical protein
MVIAKTGQTSEWPPMSDENSPFGPIFEISFHGRFRPLAYRQD